MQAIEIIRGRSSDIVFFDGERVVDNLAEFRPVATSQKFMRRGYPSRGRQVNRVAKHNAGRKVKTLRNHRVGC